MTQGTKERIVQLNAYTGQFVAIYDTAKEASVATKIHSGNISRVLTGRCRTVGGFYFLLESKWKAKRGILD